MIFKSPEIFKRYTIKPILLEMNPDKEGRFAIKICIYNHKTKKRKYADTKYRIKASQWDAENRYVKRNHHEAGDINRNISTAIEGFNASIDDCLEREVEINLDAILKGEKASQLVVAYFEKLIPQLSNKFSAGTIRNYRKVLNKLKVYSPDLKFSHVNDEWLRKFEFYLREDRKEGDKVIEGLSNNTVHGVWKILKKVFNSAIRDKVTENYPFSKYNNPTYKQPVKDWLTQEEVARIEEVLKKPLQDNVRKAANYFLLGIYSGIRISDWKRFNPSFIQGNDLILGTQKTGELVRFPVHAKLKKVIDEIFVLGKMDNESVTREHIKTVIGMAKIDKHITPHTSRRSYAVRCAEIGIDKSACAIFMGISERVCDTYYKVSNKKLLEEAKKWESV